MRKLKECLAENWIMSVILVIVLATAGCLGWKFTMRSSTAITPEIDSENTQDSDNDENVEDNEEDARFEYTMSGTLYHASTGVDAGPFQYLYTNEFDFPWETVARYIGDNGKYGYVNKDGSLLTEPVFMDAARFEDGTARVQEKAGKVYYINTDGKRITRDYQDGALNFEMQGTYCRVQEEDSTWGIVNRDDKMILSGAEMIEELPMVTTLCSAVIDGKAVLFELSLDGEREEEINMIASYDSFVKISPVYDGEFAFVWTQDDRMGVIDYKGDIIVPAVYQKIEYKYQGNDLGMDELIFLAQDENGITQVIDAKEF